MAKAKMGLSERRQALAGVMFAMPYLIGFSIFLAIPLLTSFYNSFTEYSVLREPVWIGLRNYADVFRDELFYKSLGNTLFFAAFSIPLSTIMAIALAMLLNTKVRGQAFYRTFFFLPSLVPAVPMAILWLYLFNGDFGIVNAVLKIPYSVIGLEPPNWLSSVEHAKNVLITMSVWTVGNAMIIYLAGLQEIPQQLYEASDLDGASPWQKTKNVTIPLLSPVIMFNVLMGIIGSLQYFTQAYVLFPGGAPARSTYMYSMYIYDTAFRDLRMGYASALGWVMFVIILVLTFTAFRFFDKKVHYEG
jgi:multiple sugar transport system permease protein